jgi:hypothetical protein
MNDGAAGLDSSGAHRLISGTGIQFTVKKDFSYTAGGIVCHLHHMP